MNKVWGFNYSASELLESGVEFDIGSKQGQLLDITFNEGKIRIPPLIIHETTSSLLRNLIDYEQCSLNSTQAVTSYAFLMKSLIGSSRDSNLLLRKGIMKYHHWIGGIFEFDIGSKQGQLLDITFNEGKIRIPPLIIHETTSSLLRNLIDYEQCSLNSTQAVTSYAFLMKSLIGSSRDSNLLLRKGIMKYHHWIGGEEEYLARIFKGILDEVVVKEFHFRTMCDEVNEYCTSWFHLRKLKVFLRVRVQRYTTLLFSTYFAILGSSCHAHSHIFADILYHTHSSYY
ncbi:hypothetical protein ACLB2K_063455 [Fragaria x ananassa]